QSGSYDFRYKSVECGKNDKVKVEFDTYPEADSVVFKDKYGVTYPISSKDNVLSFTGVSKADTNYIYAYRGDKKIGKLFLNTYQKKTYKVVFVRVNGAAKKLNAKEITKYLNKVYNQCAVSFEDSIDNITIGNLTSFSHGGSGVLTVYNDDQKKVLQVYDKEMKDGVYYLFFIDGVTDKKDGSGTPVSGYMPRGYNAGFIYDGGSERTIAHELGHGIAGLEHVFENSNNSGKTANLMDYANGEELWHFQWDQIQDPSRVWMKWNKDEEEGENVENLNPLISFKIKGNKTKEYDYENESLFATMHTNDKITIEILSKDTTLNIKKITWFFDKNKLTSTDSLNNKVELLLDEKTISLKGNSLSIKDSLNKEIAKLKFQAYLPPYVEFTIKETDRGKFFWDDSFSIISASLLDDKTTHYSKYDSLFVDNGKSRKKILAPVLGLQKDHEAKILLNIKDFDKLALQDNNFKIVIKSDNSSIKINNDPSFEINSSNITKGEINVKFTKILQETDKVTKGELLYAEIPSLNKKIGLIECFCKNVVKKTVTLIYVRFKASESYPNLNHYALQQYLNEQAFDQLFRSFIIDTIHFDAFFQKDSLFFNELDSSLRKSYEIFLSKKQKFFAQDFTNIKDDTIISYFEDCMNLPNYYLESLHLDDSIKNHLKSKIPLHYARFNTVKNKGDYCFITNKQKKIGYKYVGGFHYTGYKGGVFFQTDQNFNSRYDQCAHEFGHWLGLPHSFRRQPDKNSDERIKKPFYFLVKAMKDTQTNFMDYEVTRKSWFKNQLINLK
ncbi:MAG: hypothetical protein J6Z01_06385, partial [Bacteroidales bacterium]|nr:hypothetical protein [Bacteroidales bacterium]